MDLEELIDLQRQLQVGVFGYDFDLMTNEERIQYIKDMTLALEDELHEALNEVGWKPWVTDRTINVRRLRGELIDAFHFMMNLFLAADMTGDEVVQVYVAKREKNIHRQQVGYEKASPKCPACLRALDDDGVTCSDTEEWCEVYGEYA